MVNKSTYQWKTYRRGWRIGYGPSRILIAEGSMFSMRIGKSLFHNLEYEFFKRKNAERPAPRKKLSGFSIKSGKRWHRGLGLESDFVNRKKSERPVPRKKLPQIFISLTDFIASGKRLRTILESDFWRHNQQSPYKKQSPYKWKNYFCGWCICYGTNNIKIISGSGASIMVGMRLFCSLEDEFHKGQKAKKPAPRKKGAGFSIDIGKRFHRSFDGDFWMQSRNYIT